MGEMASLTRAEAEMRSALLTVERYDIALDLTGLLEGEVLAASSTITFTCTTPGASTFVDCTGGIESATLNGIAVDLSGVDHGRLAITDLQSHNVLVVVSHQTDTGTANGIQRTVDPSDKLVYVWTSFEADEARRVFACFDQPDLKAVFGFTVTAPDTWTVLTCSSPLSVTETEDGRLWSFADTHRLSTYVVVVNAGPFHEIREQRGGHSLGMYCRQSLVPLLERDRAHLFELTEHGLAWFGEKFGTPFPDERYDQVFVPDMNGSMENWGCITHSDALLPRARPTHRQRLDQAEYLLHEMAHMWFGDLVTMQWWDDLWLNEAFATWASIRCAADLPEFADVWASMLMLMKQVAYRLDMSPATHAIRSDVPDVARASANFDAITYEKGMSALRQLTAYVGEETFLTGLRAYFRDHAWGNTRLADLMGAVGAAAGRNLDEWTRVWLDEAGTDQITLDGPPWQLRLTTIDGQEIQGPHRPHRLDVASYDDEARLISTVPVTLHELCTPIDLPAAAVHLLNAGDLTFASVRSDPVSQAWLIDHAGDLPDVMSRTLAVSSAHLLMLRGETDGPAFVSCVVSVLAKERSPAVVETSLQFALAAAELWTPKNRIDEQQAQLAAVCRVLAEDPEHRLPALRALSRCAQTEEDFDLLDDGATDDLDLAWRVLTRRAELGQYDDSAVTALQRRDSDPESWVAALAARTARPDADAKAEAWQALLVDRKVPLVDNIRELTRAFWRPAQAPLLADYPDRYLDVVRSLDGSQLSAMPVVRLMYPYAVADSSYLTQARDLAEQPGLAPLVSSSLRAANDVLARQFAARAT